MTKQKTAHPVPEAVFTNELKGPPTVILESEDAFFTRVRKNIAAHSAGAPSKASTGPTLSFESLSAFIKLVTPQRARVFEFVKEQGRVDSVTSLARALHRDRSTVSKDLKVLAEAGFVHLEERILSGHGRSLSISPTSKKLRLTFDV